MSPSIITKLDQNNMFHNLYVEKNQTVGKYYEKKDMSNAVNFSMEDNQKYEDFEDDDEILHRVLNRIFDKSSDEESPQNGFLPGRRLTQGFDLVTMKSDKDFILEPSIAKSASNICILMVETNEKSGPSSNGDLSPPSTKNCTLFESTSDDSSIESSFEETC